MRRRPHRLHLVEGRPGDGGTGHRDTAGRAAARHRPDGVHRTLGEQQQPGDADPACASAAYLPGHRIVQLTTVSATSLTARPTRFVCGPDVPGDGHYEADGTPAPYALTPIATATLVDLEHGEGATVVPLTVLVQHADDCLAKREPTRPYGCYGDKYDLVSDSQGRITRISELYQP